MSEQESGLSLSPEQVIYSAFEYFKVDKLDLDSLVTIAQVANCPSPDIAKRFLSNMVEMKLLEFKKDESGTVWFNIPKVDQSRIQ
jgi:hypothetical protein